MPKIGDTGIIVGQKFNHGFKLGTRVTIIESDPRTLICKAMGPYRDYFETFFIHADDIKIDCDTINPDE